MSYVSQAVPSWVGSANNTDGGRVQKRRIVRVANEYRFPRQITLVGIGQINAFALAYVFILLGVPSLPECFPYTSTDEIEFVLFISMFLLFWTLFFTTYPRYWWVNFFNKLDSQLETNMEEDMKRTPASAPIFYPPWPNGVAFFLDCALLICISAVVLYSLSNLETEGVCAFRMRPGIFIVMAIALILTLIQIGQIHIFSKRWYLCGKRLMEKGT